jgi:hypothetical protein
MRAGGDKSGSATRVATKRNYLAQFRKTQHGGPLIDAPSHLFEGRSMWRGEDVSAKILLATTILVLAAWAGFLIWLLLAN